MSTIAYGQPRPRLRIGIDQDELEYFGVEQSDVYDTVQALFGGIRVGYSHRGEERDPIEIRIGLPKRDEELDERLAATPVPANTLPGSTTVVELGQVVRVGERAGLPGAVPPGRALRRDGHGRAGRRVRGADLWHARGRPTLSHGTTGAACRNRSISSPRSARGRERSRRCCGTANGRSPR